MPAEVQAKMEGAFGTDLSAVRIHEGPRAAALGALAYTQGTDVHFASGHYQPSSQSGQELLGHELSHVVQQSQGRVSATTQAKGVGVNDDAGLEAEADAMGAKAARGERVSGGGGAGGLQGAGMSPIQFQLRDRAEWENDSRLAGCFGDKRRSTRMRAIGVALQAYRDADDANKVARIEGVLKAIADWQLQKDRDAGLDVASNIHNLGDAVPKEGAHDNRGRSAAVNELLTEVKAEVTELLAARQEAWDLANFTNPQEHQANGAFQYLINGIQEYDNTPAHITKVLNDPASIKDALISSSLVTNTKTPMWCASGYVLRAPKENIGSAKPSDQGAQSAVSRFHEIEMYKEIVRLFNLNGLPPPDTIVEGTTQNAHQSKHNEIVVMGTGANGGATEVSAIFVATAPGQGNPEFPIEIGKKVAGYEVNINVDGKYKAVVTRQPAVSAARLDQYKEIAAEKQIPIIAIPMAPNARFSNPKLTIWDPERMIEEGEARQRDLIE